MQDAKYILDGLTVAGRRRTLFFEQPLPPFRCNRFLLRHRGTFRRAGCMRDNRMLLWQDNWRRVIEPMPSQFKLIN